LPYSAAEREGFEPPEIFFSCTTFITLLLTIF
jgi:hypothetical protein